MKRARCESSSHGQKSWESRDGRRVLVASSSPNVVEIVDTKTFKVNVNGRTATVRNDSNQVKTFVDVPVGWLTRDELRAIVSLIESALDA